MMAISATGGFLTLHRPPKRCVIPILNVTERNTYELDLRALRAVLSREEVANLPCIVISIAGAFRKGKSFLINFFIKYLRASEESRRNGLSWMGSENVGVGGFTFKYGFNRDTNG